MFLGSCEVGAFYNIPRPGSSSAKRAVSAGRRCIRQLDPRSLALLEAAPAFRADIAQSVEQRFRKP